MPWQSRISGTYQGAQGYASEFQEHIKAHRDMLDIISNEETHYFLVLIAILLYV